MKGDYASDGDDDLSTDALVEEMLQKGDTAVIYPEAPDDYLQHQDTPDTSVHNENGTGRCSVDSVLRSHLSVFSRGFTVTELSHYYTYPVITQPRGRALPAPCFTLDVNFPISATL